MKILSIIVLAAALALSCNKQIDDIRPLTKIDKEGELSSVAGIVEATVGNYSLLRGSGFLNYDEAAANIAEGRGNNVTLQRFGAINKQSDAYFFQNNNGQALGYSADFFRGAYQVVVNVNTALEGIANFEKTNLASATESDKNALMYAKGENIFLRAFVYFNLIRVYGKPYYQNPASSSGVPLKRSSEIRDAPAPSTEKESYDFIVS